MSIAPVTYKLRPYQQEMSDVAVDKLTNGGKPFLIQAATGAGKSLIIADICHKLDEPVLVLQPSLELTLQNYGKLQSYGIEDIGIYSASAGRKDIGKFTYATVGSCYRKPELFAHFKYVIVDECDLVGLKDTSSMYRKLFEGMGSPAIVGLTATPYRIEPTYTYKGGYLYAAASLKMITRIGRPNFWSGGIAYKVETQQLIDEGYLSPIKYRADNDDFHQLVVNSTGADYTKESLEDWAATKVERMADYCAYVDAHCQRNLVFCASVAQAYRLQGILLERNIVAAVVTAETPAAERAQLVADFKSGKIRHMLNCSVFLAGFDVPELDCIIFGKPTLSTRIWYQAVGRGVRLDPANPNKVLRVFDLGGCLKRMGPVESIRLTKEGDGIRDALESQAGRLDERPLYKLKVQKKVGRS